jgi:hypothetical protein
MRKQLDFSTAEAMPFNLEPIPGSHECAWKTDLPLSSNSAIFLQLPAEAARLAGANLASFWHNLS